MRRSTPGETGISRILRVLEAFDDGRSVLTPAQIVRRTGLPQSSTYRLVAEMVDNGILDPAPGGGVQTGLRLWELASRESRTARLRGLARPFLEELHERIGHHVQLSVPDGDEVVCVERYSAPGSVANLTRVAGRLPATVFTPGIVLLAFGPSDRREAVLRRPPPRALTRYTPSSADRLRAVIEETRRLGYARADGWIEEDVSARGIPIRERGTVVAALSVVLPHDDALINEVLPAAHAAAAAVSRACGRVAERSGAGSR